MREAMMDAGIQPPSGELVADGALHRYKGSEDREKKNWYILFDDGDDFQAGSFGRWVGSDNGAIKWCSKKESTLTPEEKAAWKKRQDEARRKAAADRLLIEQECKEWCQKAWDAAPPASDDHPYLQRKQVKAHGLKVMGDSLLVPVRILKGGELVGLQFIKPDGSKKFKTGTPKLGAMHIVGKPVDNTLIICEGYATAASIHEATGHAVLVAFDAGNLKPVAEAARLQKPDWTLIVASDNDAWAQEKDEAGTVIAWHPTPCELNGVKRVNTGIVKGEAAARSVKAQLRTPCFADTSTYPTDYNDLHCLLGLPAVKRSLFPPPMEPYRVLPPLDDVSPLPDTAPDYSDHSPNPLNNAPFTCLGFNYGEYFYLPKGAPQVKILRADQHSKAHMLSMAPLQWWQGAYPARSGFDTDMAANEMLRACEQVGVYDARRIRGCGAWEDAGRSILHLGNKLVVDGQATPLAGFRSKYIYEAAMEIDHDAETAQPLSNTEAHELIKLCEMLSWEKAINGRLLAGWCMVAGICGALSWRPHIWLSGSAGSGKSWVLENIINPLLGSSALIVQSNTTEAGIRQSLMNDAFPVVHDEAEGEDQSARAKMQAKLELARQASSEGRAVIVKGTTGGKAQAFRVRSCFAFASIGVTAIQQADVSRITVLGLLKAGDSNRFEEIKAFWGGLITDEFCRRIRSRAVRLIPVIRANAATFSTAVAELLGSKRTGDQLGTLLAGAYACHSENTITLDAARAWVEVKDWSEHTISDDQTDEKRCLQAILQALVRGEKGQDVAVSELIEAASQPCESVNDLERQKEARKLALRHGIKVDDERFQIASNHVGLQKMLERTAWAVGWHQVLGRLDGANKITARFGGCISKAVCLPISYVKDDAPF